MALEITERKKKQRTLYIPLLSHFFFSLDDSENVCTLIMSDY